LQEKQPRNDGCQRGKVIPYRQCDCVTLIKVERCGKSKNCTWRNPVCEQNNACWEISIAQQSAFKRMHLTLSWTIVLKGTSQVTLTCGKDDKF